MGSGVLGPVFRTYEPERDRLIAVKAFRIDLLPEQSTLLAAELQRIVETTPPHDAIVQPLAAGMEGHLPYLAQEYVAAESLDIAMKHYAPASPPRVMPFLRGIAGAIDAAAAAGILHGGLHPRDVFVTTDEARATGFGIVQAIENIGFRAPTRRPYTAPERVNGDEWGTAADIFTLGAIAHELLTARRPAGPGDQDGSFTADVQAEHRVRLREVLARALAEDPAARFDSAAAFVDALEAASQGQRMEPPRVAAAAPSPVAVPAPVVAASAAAAPSLFDDAPDAPGEPDEPDEPDDFANDEDAEADVETIDAIEDTSDVSDIDDVEDEDDIEDTDSVEDDEPIVPVEPAEPDEPEDVWPPAGFATDDLDIAAERDPDAALADFDLDLNRTDTAPVSAAGPVIFDYDTSVEDDEDPPFVEDDLTPPAAYAPAVIRPTPAEGSARPVREDDAWRHAAPVEAGGRRFLELLAGLVIGVLVGLAVAWAWFGRENAATGTDAATATESAAPAQPASSATQPPAPAAVTEVPVPAPTAAAPSTSASAASPVPAVTA
ncbi:MAG: protein kinase, partial [Acidobacteriota bacterium]|nr:protein kinase [Acidobacteriota bacterium]